MERTLLPPPLSDLLIDLAFHGSTVADPQFAEPLRLKWDFLDVSEPAGRVSWENEPLALLCEANEGVFDRLYAALEIRNEPAFIELRDGTQLRAEIAHLGNLWPGRTAQIDLHHWSWSGTIAPAYWICQVEGKFPVQGNLAIREQTPEQWRSRSDCYRLQGHYVWHLLRTGASPTLTAVIDPGEGVIDADFVRRDFLALQLAFGGPLKLSRLVGIDADRHPVAAMGVGTFTRQPRRQRAPVPDDIGQGATWIAAFFESLATRLSADGLHPLRIPIAAYLDSITDHVDGAYLKAQVGLEAFAKYLVATEGRKLLVKDEAKWKHWVKSLKPAIAAQVEDSTKLGMILGKFVSAMYAPTGDLVERAFGSAISLPEEVVEEIRKRNYPAHGFMMNSDGSYDVDRDVHRLEMIQTLMMALVALHVGYRGPLKGYEVRDDGGRHPPAWWPEQGHEVGDEQFLAERTR